MKGTIIYGNGAMARVLHSYARHTMNIVAFTVDDHCIAPNAREFCDLPLLPFSAVSRTFAPAEHSLIVAVGYLEMNALRRRKREEARAMGYASTSYVHPDVMCHDGTAIGEGCIVLDHVSIHPGCRIADGVFISSNVNIGHDCIIGDGSWINAGVAVAGGSRIGSDCFLGINASVGHGITLGDRNYIAANTFIGTDTQADQVYLSEAGQRLKMRSLDFLAMTEDSNL
jgi:sugar O-acyltransferase (sialic acid O-acetyltransferase NeuD family)